MKKQHLFLSLLGILALWAAVYLVLVGGNAAAQTVARNKISAPPKVTKTADSDSRKFTRYSEAAMKNSSLQHSLAWVFAGKNQTGWNIYVPLLSHTIGTQAGPDTPEFAWALAKWQSAKGLEANGILDEDTLGAFVSLWQKQRLGRSGTPADGALLSAPITDFFDPTRSPELLKLERQTYTAYKQMIAAASKDLKGSINFTSNGELAVGEKYLRIVSAYRSPEYQAELRRKQPNAGRGALAVNSPHSTGQALDIYVGGEPVSTRDANRLKQVETPAYKWLVKNAARFGFYPYFYEPWHWEYVPGR